MPNYVNPHTGATIGYLETSGTTVEPFNVPMLWQASTLSYVSMLADASGNLLTSGGGGGGGNAAAGLTGAAVPTSADYLGINVGGNLVGVSSANPLPIVGQVVTTALDETSRFDTTSTANATYSGSAPPGSSEASAVWKITKTNTVAGATISVLYANGSAAYNNIWANRTSLTYS